VYPDQLQISVVENETSIGRSLTPMNRRWPIGQPKGSELSSFWRIQIRAYKKMVNLEWHIFAIGKIQTLYGVIMDEREVRLQRES
jgi:hypothetical protein